VSVQIQSNHSSSSSLSLFLGFTNFAFSFLGFEFQLNCVRGGRRAERGEEDPDRSDGEDLD